MEWLTSCNLCGDQGIETIDPVANIAHCTNCGYVFDNPRPDVDEIARFYSRLDKYNQWLAEAKARDAIWKQRLHKMARCHRPGTLLDVGAGIGQFLHHARKVYAEVYGTEVSETATKIAKARYDLDLLEGDLDTIRFEEGTAFDNITLFHVLEHVPQPRQLIERCHSLLLPEGVLYIAVPNELQSLRARWLRLKIQARQWLGLSLAAYREAGIGTWGISKIRLDDSQREVHLSHFTPQVLARLLEQCGFRVIESSLDPINLGTGLAFLWHQLYYVAANVVLLIGKANIYDTIWLVASRKTVDK